MLILYCNSKILNICCCPKIQEMWWTEKYYTSKVVSTHPLDQLFQLVHLQDVQVADSWRQISSQAVTTWSVLDELQLLKFWLLSGTFAFHLAHLICFQVTVTCDSEMYLLSAFCFYWWLGCSQQNPQVRWLMRLIWWLFFLLSPILCKTCCDCILRHHLSSSYCTTDKSVQAASPVWILMCLLHETFWENLFPHTEHSHGFSPSWTVLIWIFRTPKLT